MNRICLDSLVNKNIVKCFDSNESLELFCYEECTNDSSEDLKNCRGVVFENEKLVLQAFPYTEEQSYSSYQPSSEGKCFYSMEGTLLRLFCHNSKWYLSTNKKLDAWRSRWA